MLLSLRTIWVLMFLSKRKYTESELADLLEVKMNRTYLHRLLNVMVSDGDIQRENKEYFISEQGKQELKEIIENLEELLNAKSD